MNRLRQSKYIPLILYHKFLDITNFRRAESGRNLLEIFSWKFFLGASPKIFSFPKLGIGIFLSKARSLFPYFSR